MIGKTGRTIASSSFLGGLIGTILSVLVFGGATALGASLVMVPGGIVWLIAWATEGTVARKNFPEDAWIEAREEGVLRACERYTSPQEDPNHPLYERPQRSDVFDRLTITDEQRIQVWDLDGRERLLDPRHIERIDPRGAHFVNVVFPGGYHERLFLCDAGEAAKRRRRLLDKTWKEA